MPHLELLSRVVIELADGDRAAEAFQKTIDSLILDGLAVFDSEVTCAIVSEVEGAEQVKEELKEKP